MPTRFVALPVGQGDAFFLQRGKFTALIDGGRSKHALPRLFKDTLKRTSVDTLVCTHNDADHAEGILGFLESGLKCEEVWLPALWQDRLRDLLGSPEQFFNELTSDVGSWRSDDDSCRLDQLGDQLADKGDQQEKEEERGEPISLDPNSGNDASIVPACMCYPPPVGFCCWHLRQPNWPLLTQAMSAAARIREIAIICMHLGLRIRWFRHDACHKGGGKAGLLEPLNAVEATNVRSRGALEYLALSTANRQSLTFCSPPDESYPGVVLTADSDLKFSNSIPWRAGMIVTAPHHGSEANESAYKRFYTERESEFDVIWVRSDGNFRTRPGASYLDQPTRYCTLCRASTSQKQSVSFNLSGGRWQSASRCCGC